MRQTLAVVAATLALVTAASAGGVAFFKYERVTGMTKQCVYDYLGSTYTITVGSHELCPLTIRVN